MNQSRNYPNILSNLFPPSWIPLHIINESWSYNKIHESVYATMSLYEYNIYFSFVLLCYHGIYLVHKKCFIDYHTSGNVYYLLYDPMYFNNNNIIDKQNSCSYYVLE